MSCANRTSAARLGIVILAVVLVVAGLLTSGLGEKALYAVKAFATPDSNQSQTRKGDVLVGFPPATPNPVGK